MHCEKTANLYQCTSRSDRRAEEGILKRNNITLFIQNTIQETKSVESEAQIIG